MGFSRPCRPLTFDHGIACDRMAPPAWIGDLTCRPFRTAVFVADRGCGDVLIRKESGYRGCAATQKTSIHLRRNSRVMATRTFKKGSTVQLRSKPDHARKRPQPSMVRRDSASQGTAAAVKDILEGLSCADLRGRKVKCT